MNWYLIVVGIAVIVCGIIIYRGLWGGAKKKKSKANNQGDQIKVKIYTEPDDFKKKYLKGIMFVLFPFTFLLFWHYQATWVMDQIDWRWLLLGWAMLGLRGHSLTQDYAYKDDPGRKGLKFLYSATVYLAAFGIVFWFGTGENYFKIAETYRAESTTVVARVAKPEPIVEDDFAPMQLPGRSPWQALTVTENGKMIQEVKSGQTVYVLNEQKAKFLVGVKNYSKGIFDIAKLKIPITQTGQLYFNNIPDNATLWYCVG